MHAFVACGSRLELSRGPVCPCCFPNLVAGAQHALLDQPVDAVAGSAGGRRNRSIHRPAARSWPWRLPACRVDLGQWPVVAARAGLGASVGAGDGAGLRALAGQRPAAPARLAGQCHSDAALVAECPPVR
ncbi:hypothetical protein G6F35_016988 [Rhizopus arrhizus]|nr:hypothetical protein G6F35_016988 [Rhizopus arrhizus]